jgi:hypothetical protein
LKPSNLAVTREEKIDLTNELDVKFVHEVGHKEYLDGELEFYIAW